MSETVEQPKNIHEAIVRIMENVGYVQKKKGANLNYTYAGEAALIEAIRPYMVEFGVYCYVEDIVEETYEGYKTDKGSSMNMSRVKSRIRFVHAPSGTTIVVTSRGQGADSGDKSDNKAATGAYKYALRQTFCIETGDDPDNTPSHEQQKETGSAAAASKPGKIVPQPLAKPWYESALEQVRNKSAVWDKKMGDTAHGNAFIGQIIREHVGEGQWYASKPHYLECVQRYTGFKSPEEMSWINADHMIRIATFNRAKVGDEIHSIAWEGIFTAEQWVATCEASGLKLTDKIDTADKAELINILFRTIEMGGSLDVATVGASLGKIVRGG